MHAHAHAALMHTLQNDVFTMSKRQATSHEVRLSIAYALAQSIKLSVYEGRALDLVSDEWRASPDLYTRRVHWMGVVHNSAWGIVHSLFLGCFDDIG